MLGLQTSWLTPIEPLGGEGGQQSAVIGNMIKVETTNSTSTSNTRSKRSAATNTPAKVICKLTSQDITKCDTDSSYYAHVIFKHEAAVGHSRDVTSESLLFAVC
jgi:hypothetical protein